MSTAPPPSIELWRGQSAASRVAERRERLLAAGLESLGTVGWHATTVRGVCGGAGVGLRYFYESFPDLEALLIAVYDRLADELAAVVSSRIAQPGVAPQARVHAAFASTVDFIDEDPRRGRILFRETLANDALREHGAATVPRFVSLVVAALGAEPSGTDRTGATSRSLRASALSGALVTLFLDWQSGTLKATKQELVVYCTQLTTTVTLGKLTPG
ncbi:MAG TPA: TetR/AcrR family transcriptional regulator [Mycobacterium sp.]